MSTPPSISKGAGTSSTTDYIQNSYDANDNVTNVRLRDGQNIAFTYDNLNRLTFKDRPGSEPDVSYSYDLLGRMTGASQTGQALTFGYDALGRNISQSGPLGTVQMQYDLAGNRTGITWPDAFQITYSYDSSGAMGGIYDSSGIIASFAYDNLERRISLGRISNASTTYGYDAASRVSSLTHDLTGTANDLALGFGYNPAGQITQKTVSNTLYSWQDHVNADRTYASNGRNQYTSAGATNFSYDARGNLTSSGGSAYGYNSENYLTSGPNASLSYDPLGRLFQVTSSTTNTRFLYAGTELIGEYNSAGAVLRRYVHGPAADEPIVRYEGTGLANRWFLHADERGSIVAMSNGTGSMFQINSFDEYGIPGAGNNGRFQYTGQSWISELGMYYYKARFYSPTLGRFMQTDPIGYADGMNLYAYVGNDPINFVDPTGLMTYAECKAEQALKPNEIIICGGGGSGTGGSIPPSPGGSGPSGPGGGGSGPSKDDEIVVTAKKKTKWLECAGDVAWGALEGFGISTIGTTVIDEVREAADRSSQLDNDFKFSREKVGNKGVRLGRSFSSALRIGGKRAAKALLFSNPYAKAATVIFGAGVEFLSSENCGIQVIPESFGDIIL